MRIGIDAHFVGVRHSGNERYFESLIRALLRRADNGGYYVFSHRGAAAPLLPEAGAAHVPLASRSVWWQRGVEIPRHARRLALDVLHVPFNFLPVARCRTVVTIHDLGFLRLPQAYAPLERWRMRWLTALAARRASHVITGSEWSRRDIVDTYGLREDRVSVAPIGVDHAVFRPLPDAERRAARERLGLPGTYLLAVGVIQPRKNLGILVRALEALRSQGRDVHLVLAGRSGYRAAELFRAVRERGLTAAVHYLGAVSTADLVALYNNALALVFPSLCEGFGIPVLEAMGCGCPVVSSNSSALPEVYGDAALSFDPQDGAALIDRLGDVLDDAGLRERLRARGLARAAAFTWERTAAVVRGVYDAA